MISMPTVKYSLGLLRGDGGGNLPGALSVVCLPGTVIIHCLEIHNPPGAPVMFWSNYHPATPCGGCVDWNTLQDSKTNISVWTLLYLGLPVLWNCSWSMHGDRLGFLVNKEPEGGTTLHEREGLMLAGIE